MFNLNVLHVLYRNFEAQDILQNLSVMIEDLINYT